MSSYAEENMHDAFGGDDAPEGFLRKPFPIATLLQTVTEIIIASRRDERRVDAAATP